MTDDPLPRAAQALAPGLTDQTGFLIQRLHSHSRRMLNEALRPLGIEARHLGVLAALANQGPLIQRQLINLLEIDKSSLVYVLDDLQDERLVERRSVPYDRRAFAVHITQNGRERLKAAIQTAQRVNETLFGWLDPKDREQFHRTLSQLVDRLPAQPIREETHSPAPAETTKRRSARRSETHK
jgi:DNA-binding MarR family transcriptional regulator